jgi:hypothetical protein
MKMSPRELMRTKEPVYKTLRIAARDLSDDELVELMVKNPDLIQRPIVEKGARAILARPAERLKEILQINSQRPTTNDQPLPTPNFQLRVAGSWNLGVVGRRELGLGSCQAVMIAVTVVRYATSS